MNISINLLWALAAGLLVEVIVLHFLMGMLERSGAVRANYLGVDIPVSAGMSFPITIIVVFILFALFSCYQPRYHVFIFGLTAISFLGFIDDMLGRRDTLGFKGHIGELLRGRMTTGGLKATGGFIIAFFIAFFSSHGMLSILLNTLLIALFTNLLNLFDLRPGRAVKAYLFFLLVILLSAHFQIDYLIYVPLLGAVLWYFRYDLKARVMMGDAGSNVLGLALGYYAMIALPLSMRIGMLVFLIAIHIYTEKYSLTSTIEKVSFLKWLDNLGRKNWG
ncbi:hypothetical protein [Syntrophomonas palmitatica]|uniref:hypothetical protein n=1 Tax=Syntrophomonas palmitatica TaxID=402877 RepID=UPI000B243449|nr:hypothetical protein [Syntrophomonas palmitatica]